MNTSFAKPWIGGEYEGQNNSPRILILGESHYGQSHEQFKYDFSDKTILCIRQQISNEWPYKFYTRIASTFLGHRPNLQEKTAFWHRVSYHNLITEPLPRSRYAPTQEQWNKSFNTLPDIISLLKPRYCVVLGYRMWGQLCCRYDLKKIKSTMDLGPKGILHSSDMKCYFHGIKHPSGRGYINSEWHRFITNGISCVETSLI